MAIALHNSIHRTLTRIPLRWVLVVPFVLQTVGAVALVGYLSYRSGQQSVQMLADQLMNQTSSRVRDRLNTYLGKPEEIINLNQAEIEQGIIDTKNQVQLQQHFLRQMNAFQQLNSIGWGGAQGGSAGIGRDNAGVMSTPGALLLSDESTPGVRRFYVIDQQGKRLKLLNETPGFDARQRPWYQVAASSGQPKWTSIYPFQGLAIATLNFSAPVYQNGELQGVLSSAILLSELNLFLKNLNFSPSGQVFIIERDGNLVASSTGEQPFAKTQQQQNPVRKQPIFSNNRLTQIAARALQTQWRDLQQIQTPLNFVVDSEGQRQFAQVVPYQDSHGLDWLLVVVIPQSDFMGAIEANNVKTALLCVLTLLVTTAFGGLTAGWITKPIAHLSQASHALAQGKWSEPLSEELPIVELKTLTHAFNQTAEQLQQSFERIKIALEESEEKFTTVFRTCPDSIAITTLEGRFLEVNGSFLRLSEYKREEVLGKTLADLNLSSDATQDAALTEILQTQGRVESFEFRYRTKFGKSKITLLSLELVELDGQPTVITVCKDITDRKQTEAALRESEATNRALIQAIPDFLVRMHEDGTYLSFNETDQVDRVNLDKLEAGISIFDALPSWVAEERLQYAQKALATQTIQIYEYELVTEEGHQYEEARIVPCSEQEVLIMVRDISERKRTEQSLRESEERFRLAFDDAAIGMAIVALNGHLIRVNHSLCEILGYAESELLQRTFQTITYPDDLNPDLHNIQQLLEGKQRSFHLEKRYIHKQGHLVWAILGASLIRDESGTPLYFVSQIQDISDRHSAERVKDEFISIVSHELRTPLTAIRGSLGLLKTGKLDSQPDKFSHVLEMALNNSNRLVQLINDILDLERLESGAVEIVKEDCDVVALLQQGAEAVSPLANQSSISIQLQSATMVVKANFGAIVQTLTNLLSNAIKFSPPDSIIWVSADAVHEWMSEADTQKPFNLPHTLPATPFPFMLFAITDQGRGIPANKLDAVFGRFQQVDASDSRQKGGTGLGLTICKSIIQQHGGQIWAESRLGEGSTFYFTLPL